MRRNASRSATRPTATPASTAGRPAPSHAANDTPSARKRASINAHSSAARAEV